MLARVLKKSAAAGVAVPFSVASLDGSPDAAPADGPQQWIVPEIAPIEPPFTIEHEEPHYEIAENLSVDQMLDMARAEAERIIAQAEEHAAIIEQVASDKAVNKAKEELAAETAAKFDELRSSYAKSVAELAAAREQFSAGVERELVELALQIAKKVVAREVSIDREIALTLVKVSLGKLHNRAVAEIHLNPEDYTYVKNHLDKLDYRGQIELIEDKSIGIGGCLVHTETGDIDARIESQFDEISHGLLT
jgi:flagellar assembly protein FliH